MTLMSFHSKNSSVDVTVASINNPKSSSAKLAVNKKSFRLHGEKWKSISCKLIHCITVPFAVSKSRNVSRGDSLSAEGKAARPAT